MKNRPQSDSVRGNRSSTNLSYGQLEHRNLLAADAFASTFDFSDGTGIIRTLAEPVPMQERFDVLRDVVGAGQEDTFRRTSLVRDQIGFAHLKHQQYHGNIPIEGATYTTHIKDRIVVSVSGSFLEYAAVDSDRSLSEADALSEALNFVDADLYMWESLQHDHTGHNHDVDCMCCDCLAGQSHYGHDAHDHETYSNQAPEGELIYLPTEDGDLVLTFKFDVYAVAPLSRQNIFVDASTGSILETHDQIHHADVAASGTSLYDGTVNFTADDVSGPFRLRQVANGVETYDLNNGTSYGGAADITSTTTNFTASDVRTGVQAHFGAEETLQYFFNEHGRDSYDGNGATLRSYVSYGTDYVNAFWDGSRMTYGDGNGTSYGPLVSLDIVGHEVSHGVTGNTAGLIYQNESGALNESFSDIFGEAIENYATGTNDWLMGDDIGIGGSGALRNMANPNQYGDPDTYFGNSWYTGTGDNGGVHINSGVQNKWFYILSVGEAGTNDNGDAYDVTGIGMQDAGAIAYRNLSVYLNQNSNYAEAREGALQAAVDLFGAGSTQHDATAAAWDAVGVYGPEPPTFSFASVKSLGAGIYRGTANGSVAAGSTVSIPVDLDANQKFSVVIAGTNGLTPTVELHDPSGKLLGSNTGSSAMLQNIVIGETGTYEISILGDAGSSGDFEALSLLNSGFETEWQNGSLNNSLATAENIETSSVTFGANSSVDRLAVMAQLEGQTALYADSFESGSLGSEWATSSSNVAGRIIVTDGVTAADGSFSLFMDVTQNDTYNLNEAILSVDLDPASKPILTFSHAEWSDETNPLPNTFSGSSDGDGVAISADGVNWFTILTGTNNDTDGAFSELSFDLATLAGEAGITLGNDFKVKFQQYDNYAFSDDGRAYDSISITPQESADDWFEFDLDANQMATVTASVTTGGGDVAVSLYDASGNLVQAGIATDNFNSVVADVSDENGGTFYARVSGSLGAQYNLVVTRGAALDVEPNDSSNAFPIDEHIGVFGFVSNVGTGTIDPDAADNGERVDDFFEGVTLSNAVNGGGIYAAFASGYSAPTGDRVFGPSDSASNGFREFETEFQADFNSLQTTVSIDVGSDDTSDVGFLRAYDLQGNLLQEVVSGSLASGASETLTISRATPEIAFVVAAGVGTDITPFDNLVFSAGSVDTDYFSVELVAGELLFIDASLPGAGPNLFENGLDQETSQLRVELIDPNGGSIATDSEQLVHTATQSGTFLIKVTANSGEGEYLLRHNVNQLPVEITVGDGSNSHSNVDQLTLNFGNVVDFQSSTLTLVQRETGQSVDFDWTIDNSSGQSLVTVTFAGALAENGGSLKDGNYQLTVDGSLFGGNDFIFGDDEADNFYRFYGDGDGNRTVNVFDLLPFRQTYLSSAGDDNFDAGFDSNGDGTVNVLDLLKFRQNFGETLEWV